jgi:RNA polymerase sigma-70 factor (ECF subfamily)
MGSNSEQGARPPVEPSIMAERQRVINVAYRLLGSLADAEDAVQDAYARWYALTPAEQQAIASPGAWLTTVTSRICLDVLRSARHRREKYVGPWLPEPLPDSTEWTSVLAGKAPPDPADRITLDESVDMAFLVVLDAMTPAERVSFLLHDVFGYSFAEVAGIVGRTPAACRQLASSARCRIREARPEPTSSDRRAGIVREFKQAWENQDIATLVTLFDPAVTVTGDSGGFLPHASPQPVRGRERIATFLAGFVDGDIDFELAEHSVNGQPGLVATQDGVPVSVYAFEIAENKIKNIWVVLNPEKLRAWRAAPDLSGG